MTEQSRNRARYILSAHLKHHQTLLESQTLLQDALDSIDAALATLSSHGGVSGGGRCVCRACQMRDELTR